MSATWNGPAGSCRAARRARPDARPSRRRVAIAAAFGLACLAAAVPGDAAPRLSAAQGVRVDALDCDDVGAGDVPVLAQGPAPRVVLLDGSVPIVTMEPFARFLAAMGYPRAALADPRDGGLSRGSYGSADALAGVLAGHYEQDGLRPMLIGHSQGGALVVRTLHALAGRFGPVEVRDVATGEPLGRTTIVDPRSGETRDAGDVTLSFAAALATGALPRVVLLQWSTLPLLRRIPDSVDEFAGYRIPGDMIAGDWLDGGRYEAIGNARVRNVTLPAATSHVAMPDTEALARDPAMRAWIDAYRAARPADAPPGGADARNAMHAADVWDAIKRHWCAEQKAMPREGTPR